MAFEARLRTPRLAFGTVLSLAVSLATSAAAQEPSASARATARALMDDGFDRKDRGDLHGALEQFAAADALVHAPTTALEAARTEEALGLLVEARNRLEAIAPTGPAGEYRELTEARAAAGRLADDLDARIPRVRFTLEQTRDATLVLDGESIPRAARDVVHRLDPGAHVVVAHAASGADVRISFTLAEHDARAIAIPEPAPVVPPAPVPSPVRAAPPLSSPAPPSGHTPARTLAYASFGVGGAGLVAGIVAGAVALASRNTASSQCPGGECPPAAFHDLDTAQTASTVANVGFIVAAIGAAVGVADLLFARDPGASVARGNSPHVSFDATGLRGTF